MKQQYIQYLHARDVLTSKFCILCLTVLGAEVNIAWFVSKRKGNEEYKYLATEFYGKKLVKSAGVKYRLYQLGVSFFPKNDIFGLCVSDTTLYLVFSL